MLFFSSWVAALHRMDSTIIYDLPRTVERPSRLPCRHSYRHSSKNVGKDADVAT